MSLCVCVCVRAQATLARVRIVYCTATWCEVKTETARHMWQEPQTSPPPKKKKKNSVRTRALTVHCFAFAATVFIYRSTGVKCISPFVRARTYPVPPLKFFFRGTATAKRSAALLVIIPHSRALIYHALFFLFCFSLSLSFSLFLALFVFFLLLSCVARRRSALIPQRPQGKPWTR